MFRKLGFGRKKEKEKGKERLEESPEVEVDEPEGEDLPEAEGESPPVSVDEAEEEQELETQADVEKKGFFARLVRGLAKTRRSFITNLNSVVLGRLIDDELLEDLEEVMITADMGMSTTAAIIEEVRKKARERGVRQAEAVVGLIKESIRDSLEKVSAPFNAEGGSPTIVMVIGVNGAGKTTTIGKLAYSLRESGKKVMLAAGDTFRAAAIEQLEVWAGRAGAEIIKGRSGGDPSAVIYDSIQAAKSRGCDVVIADTAGRLHTKVNLMEELKKMKRIVGREVEDAPHEMLLVLDATTGQNAITQARMFHEALGVTGIALTKLDGTARGGVVIGIVNELGIPLKFIGVGEQVEDLRPFDPSDYVEALFQEA